MRTYYFKRLDADGNLLNLVTYRKFHPTITDPLTVEITVDEYNTLLAEIESANQPEEPDPDEISAEEALDIILGGAP